MAFHSCCFFPSLKVFFSSLQVLSFLSRILLLVCSKKKYQLLPLRYLAGSNTWRINSLGLLEVNLLNLDKMIVEVFWLFLYNVVVLRQDQAMLGKSSIPFVHENKNDLTCTQSKESLQKFINIYLIWDTIGKWGVCVLPLRIMNGADQVWTLVWSLCCVL